MGAWVAGSDRADRKEGAWAHVSGLWGAGESGFEPEWERGADAGISAGAEDEIGPNCGVVGERSARRASPVAVPSRFPSSRAPRRAVCVSSRARRWNSGRSSGPSAGGGRGCGKSPERTSPEHPSVGSNPSWSGTRSVRCPHRTGVECRRNWAAGYSPTIVPEPTDRPDPSEARSKPESPMGARSAADGRSPG